MRLDAILRDHARRRPDHPALICEGHRLSYAELAQMMDRAAAGLDALGVRPGDRVLIHLPRSEEHTSELQSH